MELAVIGVNQAYEAQTGQPENYVLRGEIIPKEQLIYNVGRYINEQTNR